MEKAGLDRHWECASCPARARLKVDFVDPSRLRLRRKPPVVARAGLTQHALAAGLRGLFAEGNA